MSEKKELNDFLQELYTNEYKKTVLLARENRETLEEVSRKLGVTREFVRQVEAKITRKFAMSQSGRKIRESLIALCSSGAVQSTEDLKAYFGEHGAELEEVICPKALVSRVRKALKQCAKQPKLTIC